MTQEILINAGAAEIRIAAVEDGKLQALTTAAALEGGHGSRIGEILLGRVQKVIPAIQAAFVEIGMERAGFLGMREARALHPDLPEDAEIGDVLREGDAVLVQIVKDQIGEKGARLSAAVSVPGRLCVLTPHQAGVCLSRRILDEEERARLTALGEEVLSRGDLPDGAGLILRTNAYGAGIDELADEALVLAETWQGICEARRSARAPASLHHDLDPIARALRDLAKGDGRILIDDAAAFHAARDYCRTHMPQIESCVELFEGPGTLFDMHDIESDIEALAQRRVALPCGGWITIEPTEALCAVDVNSGSFTAANGIEDTGVTVNLEAAAELGRQIRLRGIGGVIVVDFIHMASADNAAKVLTTLEDGLARDGRPVQIAPLSPFGLVEITRKRLRETRERLHGEPCPCCSGSGHVSRPASVAMEVIRRIEETAKRAPGAAMRVEAAPDVVRWIQAQGESLAEALAKKGAVRIAFVANEKLPRNRFEVGTHA